jgi:hypothetical protein
MTSPLPAHLAAAIRERIGVLRETARLDEVHASSHPTFPSPHGDDVRRWLTGFLTPHRDDVRGWSPPRQDHQFRAQKASELQF